jgi:hypothetical protein
VRAQLTDQKVAMEMLLAKLGVSAKTNFIQIKGMFDAMDKDGSGDVDGDELAGTAPVFCLLSARLCNFTSSLDLIWGQILQLNAASPDLC